MADLVFAKKSKVDRVTRADVTEILAAAMLIADGFTADELFLPNVPKMSRKKSESGLDATAVRFGADSAGAQDVLRFASVKHSVNATSAAGVRWKAADSLTRSTMTPAYLAVQMRVLNARLREQGTSTEVAKRIYYFLRADSHVTAIGVAAVDSDLSEDLDIQVLSLPTAEWDDAIFRKVGFLGLRGLAADCP